MKKEIPKHYCPYPFTQMTTTPTGLWKLCCSASEAHGFVSDFPGQLIHDIEKTNMSEYWNGDYLNWVRDQHLKNIPIKECQACFEYEQNGSESYRQRALKEFGYHEKKLEHPISLDLKLGNLCNSSCLFCDPSSSSKIKSEWEAIGWDQEPPFKSGLTGEVGPELFKINFEWPQRASFWNNLIDISTNIKNLKFTGGEPLINPYMMQYLRYLVDKGLAPNIRLQTTSNGIKVPDEFLVLTDHFREVQLNFSVDGFGKQNEYIRYPTKWDSWLRNMEKVQNRVGKHVELYFQHSISAYSVFGLVEYFKWLWSYKRFRFHLFRVYHPEFQQPDVLEKNEAEPVAADLESLASDFKLEANCERDHQLIQEILGIVTLLRTLEDKSSLKPHLKKYLMTLDAHRKISIVDYMPKAAESLGIK